MDIVVITTIITSFFVVIGVAEPLAARMRLPYSVILAVLGIVIGLGATFFLNTDLTDALNPGAQAIIDLPIRSDVFLYVFLPTLLFQATLGMNLRRMLDDWMPILMMAVVAVIVATLSIGYALSWVSALPLVACLLIGAIVSTTDPSAVVSIFRSISAPRRLSRIIEGESLLNDAAAIALFGLFMSFVMLGRPDPSLSEAVGQFPLLIAGGALTGWLMARMAVWIMAFVDRWEKAQISISVALPYLAYIVAEQSVGASGVIAVVVTGLTLNLTGPGRLSPFAWTNLQEVWDLLAHWAGALIFILAALLIPRLLEGVQPSDFGLLAVVVLAATLARAAVLFGLLPLLTTIGLSPFVERPYRSAMLWGGLRGAVTLALALAVTESTQVPLETKRLVGILATGFTLFTLIVQGTTLRTVITKLGLDELTPLDTALSRQVVAVALQSVREDISRTAENYDLTHQIVRNEAKQFSERLDEAVKAAEDSEEILDRDRITLGLIALAGAERDSVLARMRERTMSSVLSEKILSDADRLIEGARTGGRIGYQRASNRSVVYSKSFRIAVFLHNRLRISFPLTRLTADRFERLLMQRLILRDLDGFVRGRIRRIHGRRVAELLDDLLERRSEAVETALEGLRLQYPGYAEKLERRFIRRTALRLEEREYAVMREDGLVGEELYSVLMQEVAARRALSEGRPVLDIALKGRDLVRQFPLFSDLDKASLRKLSRALRTHYANAGDTILSKDELTRSVFFIASGAVEVEFGRHTTRLGRGEMFGQLAMLMKRPRRVNARALAPSTLLMLDEASFRRLLRRSKAMRKSVEMSAAKRMIDPAVLDLDEPSATS
ncbi:cation:proton antiporter [Ruegeria profundi]|uniref:cation:proton antiporter n=1 Tax=Ruegeria profundi TaxID=1685378 RepID=UPI003C7DF960